jgi:hypothetical protein
MKRMRTTTYSDSATSESDVENSYNTDNEFEIDSASESDSDNVDDTSSEVGDEYGSDPLVPLKAEAAQQSLSEFEELTQSSLQKVLTKTKLKTSHTYLSYQNFVKICKIFIWIV